MFFILWKKWRFFKKKHSKKLASIINNKISRKHLQRFNWNAAYEIDQTSNLATTLLDVLVLYLNFEYVLRKTRYACEHIQKSFDWFVSGLRTRTAISKVLVWSRLTIKSLNATYLSKSRGTLEEEIHDPPWK